MRTVIGLVGALVFLITTAAFAEGDADKGKNAFKGTKMVFKGIEKEKKVQDFIAYLKIFE